MKEVSAHVHKFREYLLDPVPAQLWRHERFRLDVKLGFCDTCGFYHVDPYPEDDFLAEYYSQYEMPTEQANLAETARLLGRNLKAGATILDMGCGDGAFLMEMKKLGFTNLSGFDQSPGIERAKQLGLGHIYSGSIWQFLEDAEKQGGSELDAFVMVNVLEHVPEPGQLLSRLQAVMKPGGVLAVTVPNDFSPLQKAFLRVKGHLPWFVCLPDHLNYLDFDSLSGVLNRHGFEEIDRSALYPLELFLLQDLDYIENPALGPKAHNRRVQFENNMKEAGMTDELDRFYQTLAAAGYGRDAMMISRKAGKPGIS